MKFRQTSRFGRNNLCVLITASILTACGGGGGADDSGDNTNTPPTSTNSAPSISGDPSTAVIIDTLWSFTPSASDPDDDSLTFAVENLPQWATLDSQTGLIAGTPGLQDVGVHDGIVVSVSDGSLSASLAEFSVEVSQMGMGSATLTWTPPTQNTDGSTLTDLSGYRIYYGTNPGNYTNIVEVDDAGVSSFVVTNLAIPNTYYFVATALNSSNIESAFTTEVSKVLR